MKTESKINCPNCGTEINVNDILKHQIEEGLRRDFLKEKKELLDAQKVAQDKLQKEREALTQEKESADEKFQERLALEKKSLEKELNEKLKSKLQEENAERFKNMQEELAEKSERLKDLYQKEVEIEKLKRQNGEIEDKVRMEAEKSLNERLGAERELIKKQLEESSSLKVIELTKQLEQQKALTLEMKRKQEQGSMQLQGEVYELAIEEWLQNQFPLDQIEEIKKGANGADCLQIVHTRERQNCGTIYYESKRTKAFQPTWIDKFKNDIRDKGADIGILVTEVLPKDMERMGLVDGIWICTFSEFKSLCAIIREHIILLSRAQITQVNKGDKMNLLYDYLTSSEFRMRIEGIVEGFSQMQIDLLKEKNAMERLWKKREKELQKVISNTIAMHGSIRGIAGGAVDDINLLEL